MWFRFYFLCCGDLFKVVVYNKINRKINISLFLQECESNSGYENEKKFLASIEPLKWNGKTVCGKSNINLYIKKDMTSLSEVAKTPPKSVVKAKEDYRSDSPHVLSFRQGDFFLVVNDTLDKWLEVADPARNLKGLVPRSHFIQVRKSQTDSVLRATALYDFKPERTDELSMTKDDELTVLARSSALSWMAASLVKDPSKSGLVPVNHVSFHGRGKYKTAEEAFQAHPLPTLDEWKKSKKDLSKPLPTFRPSVEIDTEKRLRQKSPRITKSPSTASDDTGPFKSITPMDIPETIKMRFILSSNNSSFTVRCHTENLDFESLCRLCNEKLGKKVESLLWRKSKEEILLLDDNVLMESLQSKADKLNFYVE